MQLRFSFVDEMMTVSWKMFSIDVWVCVHVRDTVCAVQTAWKGPFAISDSLAIKQPL